MPIKLSKPETLYMKFDEFAANITAERWIALFGPEWKKWRDKIDRVIFNDPATIILWKSGEKTVVKCGPNDIYDKEKGLAMALCKYVLGNKGNFNQFFKSFMEEDNA